MSRFLGEIKQLGYVVEDIEAAMKYWTEVLGVGPFYYMERVPLKNYRYQGEAYEPHNSVALANAGNVQVELIQTRGDTPSMYRDFIRTSRAGLQHVAYWTEDFDRDLHKLLERGWKVGMSGEVGERGRFVYFETEYHPGTVIELSEVAGPKGKVFRIIRESAQDWDGSDPVRAFPDLEQVVMMGPVDLPGDGSRFVADYLIETPLEPAQVAEVMAGEQSCGTFVRVQGETDQLRERARAVVLAIDELESVPVPSLPNAWQQRQQIGGPYRRARIRISFPVANIGPNLPTLAATVAGNLFDLGEVTGLRLLDVKLPSSYRRQFDLPRQGIAGTRKLTGVAQAPLLGTIIKPNVGLSAEETADLVGRLCEAGVDFIKDDEVCANPSHAPLEQRVKAVMKRVRAYQDKSGRRVMVAFNITDELDAMRRHAELIEREGGSCAMVGLNWCGFSAVQSLRRSTPLALHGHRNGFGMMSREPLLGMSFPAYQAMWRLAGVDHLHVHGLNGKFSEFNEEVVESARACLAPLVPMSEDLDDAVMPVFSNGQWAGTVRATFDAINSSDVIFLSGGGILAHPDGAAAGVASLRQAWDAARAGISLQDYAKDAPELQRAIAFYGAKLK